MEQQLDTRSTIVAIAVAVFIGFAGMATGVVLGLVAIVGLLVVGISVLEDVVLLVVVATVAQGAGFGLVAVGYLSFRAETTDYVGVRVPSLREVGWIVGGIVATFAALIALSAALSAMGVQTAEHTIADMGEENPEILLALVPLSFLVIGPGEELLFRGIIQTYLVDRLGSPAGILAASIIFTLAHFEAYSGSGFLGTMLILFTVSVLFGGIYEVTDNVVVPAIIHGAYNAIISLVLYVSLTGGELAIALYF